MIAVLQAGLILGSGGYFLWRRLTHLLRYFQQEEYDARRFWAWCRAQRAFDRRGASVALPAAAAALIAPPRTLLGLSLAAAAALVLALVARSEADPRATGKKRLVMTQRARRIRRTAFAFGGLAALAAVLIPAATAARWVPLSWLLLAATIQLAPTFLMLATRLLAPGERRIQASFYRDARDIFERVHPFVVAITGSYGKTSTKHMLASFLAADAPTFRTEKSINTVMGVTREIREKMRPNHRWAVMEMGAYGPGSIARLCAFTPPDAAIITAIGLMHLERFGSPERIYQAKSELPQAVPPDGILVCNGDDAGARRMAVEFRKATTLLYGFDAEGLDCRMSDVVPTPEGTQFTLSWRGATYRGSTGLYGRPMLSNLLAAFTMAATLGVHPDVLLAVARNLKPSDNRLQVEKRGPITWIHDAYNSNPTGFESALDVLAQLPGQRRVLITPGMVELGDQQFEENRRLAHRAAGVVDLAFVVGDVNREALVAGLHDGGAPDDAIRLYAHRDDALAAIRGEQSSGDVVLIENDLPDLYEGALRL